MAQRDLVAQGIGQRLDGPVGGDAVAGEVERGMEVGQLERAGPGENAERHEA
ncbi:MAG: hypothetical protein ACHQE5_09815 [Actinomycetes bacterium]